MSQVSTSSDNSLYEMTDDIDFMNYLSGESEQRAKLESSISKFTEELSDQYSSDEAQSQVPYDPAANRKKIMGDIEGLFLKLIQDTVAGKPLKLSIRNTRSWANCVFDEKLSLKPGGECAVAEVRYSEQRFKMKFSLIYFALSEIYKLLATQETCTKRELYYQHVERIRSQAVLDGVLNNICCLLAVPLHELNIFASSKGLVFGPVKLVTAANVTDCSIAGGTLIPDAVCHVTRVQSDAKFVLVIEKDAIFQKLLDNDAARVLCSCIFVTGKGFPDVNTRLLVRKLWDALRIPILALVDPDPWGIEIMCVYRFGSLAMSHQADQLAVPSVRWLGVHPTEVDKLYDSKLPLLAQDATKLGELMRRPYIQANGRIQREIQCMLDRQCKAEIEGVEVTPGYLANVYLPQKIACADFI